VAPDDSVTTAGAKGTRARELDRACTRRWAATARGARS